MANPVINDLQRLTGSNEVLPASLDVSNPLAVAAYRVWRDDTMTLDQQVVHKMVRDIEVLKSELLTIKNNKLVEELNLPIETLDQLGLIKDKRTAGGGRVGNGNKLKRPLLESEIELGYEKGYTAAGAARYLEVCFETFKKWAKYHGIYRTHCNMKGIKRPQHWETGKYPLSEILAGKHPDVPIKIFIAKLFRSGLKKRKCEQCGFSEKRITDGAQPLVLNHLDNNVTNHSYDNLVILCYNCTFVSGRGSITGGSYTRLLKTNSI
jgi:hypothetical protein